MHVLFEDHIEICILMINVFVFWIIFSVVSVFLCFKPTYTTATSEYRKWRGMKMLIKGALWSTWDDDTTK